MMSLSSSQAGIVGARRNKLNQTQFSSYRYVKVEYNNPVSFVNTPPSAKSSFTARHIYSYSKINNTFTLLGVQKAQSLKREWVNQVVFTGSNPSQLDGTYIRSPSDSKTFLKSGNQGTFPRILREGTSWVFYEDIDAPLFAINTRFDNISYLSGCNGCSFNLPSVTVVEVDNTILKNINNNRLYSNTNADIAVEQLLPDVNFNINTANIFDTKNLAQNEKVFVDVRWITFADDRRRGFNQGPAGGFDMNNRKGNIYRAGIIIKDNTIDSMLYHTDLATNSAYLKQMQKGVSFNAIGF
jgi:hypothetical protein